MVARHRFVHAQYLDLILGTDFRTVQVHPINAGTTAIRSWSRVVRGRRVGRDRVRNGFYAVGHAGQLAKKPYQLRIDTLTSCEVGFVQIVGVIVVELRVSSKVDKEVLKAAIKFDLLDDLDHLVSNAFDLLKTQPVDIVRRHSRRCE